MNNPFQDQLLKAGVVTKKQVQKAKQDKSRTNKKQRATKETIVNETELKAQQAAEKKARRDLELNKKKEEQARQKSISIEIDQLISSNRVARDDSCDIVYNFEHKSKVKRIHVNEEQKQKVINGKLGIARIEGRYELVPQVIAEKIQKRNAKRVVILTEDSQATDENDPYADHQIPDDLTW
jgi:uncharacterized protein YaiL (DUF2058 family)